MWSWILHRVTGVGVLFFLFLHVLDTALVGFGPEAYDAVIALYRAPAVRILEVVLVAAVLFHALNGLRIILIDFWPRAVAIQRQLFWAVVVGFLVLFVPAALAMLRPLLAASG